MSSRRESVTRAGAAAGGTIVAGALRGLPAAAQTLKVGFVKPRTGALAGFGEGDPYVLDRAREALGTGLNVGGTTHAVEIADLDSQSDPARAGQLAKELITNSGIYLMLTTSTPETVNRFLHSMGS